MGTSSLVSRPQHINRSKFDDQRQGFNNELHYFGTFLRFSAFLGGDFFDFIFTSSLYHSLFTWFRYFQRLIHQTSALSSPENFFV